jgi:hypothetical protein
MRASVPHLAQHQGCVVRNSLIQDQTKSCGQSRRVAFRCHVFQIGCGKRQRLPDVIGLEFGIVSKEIFSVRIYGDRIQTRGAL